MSTGWDPNCTAKALTLNFQLYTTSHSFVTKFKQHLHAKLRYFIAWYSSACASYQYFLKMTLLPTRKLLTQRIVKFRLKSSLRKFYSHHHAMVDIYEMSGSHDSVYVWTLVISCNPFKFVSDNFDIILSNTASTIYGGGTVHPSEAPEVTPNFSLGLCWSSWIFSLFTLLVVRLFLQSLWLPVSRLS